MNISYNADEKSNSNVNKSLNLNILLLIIYFIIRIPVTFIQKMDALNPIWKRIATELCFFTIIGLLIIINRKKLQEFFIDKIFLIIFFMFGIVFRIRTIDTFMTLFFEAAIRMLLVMFLLFIIFTKTRVSRFPLFTFWNGIGILAGSILAAVVIVIASTTVHFQNISLNHAIGLLIKEIIRGFGDVILEEPIFRGFLWGTLLLLNWKERYIFVLQTFLFWMSHLSYAFSTPISFWIIGPIISLLLGFLTWKSHSIIPSTLAHIFYNSIIGVSLFLEY